ncbi:MAG: hypothetical protein HC921_03235 [Synechococcaceae cyanobacterium SM2_3_1]|nr:hypothetical protein [Synechococcaceae cyanobacterium SM2_3_1]
MANFNRGIMEFKGADSPLALTLSTLILAAVVGTLLWWALGHAYTL